MNSNNDPELPANTPKPILDATAESQGILDKRTAKPGFWSWFNRSFSPFRNATLRGIGIVLPPLLTIIIFIWVWNTLDRAILTPVESLAQNAILYFVDQTQSNEAIKKLEVDQKGKFETLDGERVFVDQNDKQLIQVKSKWIPHEVFATARDNPGSSALSSASDYYRRYIQVTYLKRHIVIPAFLAFFTALLYLLGKLLAIGLGRMGHHYFEQLVNRVPIIRNVYSSVKQVTDLAFSEKTDVQFNRVVALEYPRKGIWVLAFVTGEGMAELSNRLGEPTICCLVPTSPMPATGFSIVIPKSETIEVDISIDQAFQFCVSCGVVVPEHQSPKHYIEGMARNLNPGGERRAS